MPEPSSGRFGTITGVFTPVVLTILGVIMFMRTGFVVGHAGLWLALLILALAKVITSLTTLSLSAIATNLDVRVGGVYFMISRVLGPDFGGSIGITLFIAQAVSVAFYTIGFTEAIFGIIGSLSPDVAQGLVDAMAPQLISSAVVTGLFVLTFKGADVALKAQYGVLAVLLLSVAAFLIGGAMEFDASTFEANRSSAFTSDVGFWTAFAIFFPAATGISAGANMSGDLKDPAKSIPSGTIAAIIFTAIIYVVLMVLSAGSSPRADMIADPFGSLQRMSLWGPLIVAGVFAATLSSALGSFLGAPRILQAMGQDRLMKPLEYFGKGSGPANEPRRATVLTFLIAVAVIWAGDLNAVAEVISMFFLIAYGMINTSAFVESKSANPSFRPRFRAFHWSLALAGAIGCLVAMVKINETYALVAFGITGLLYFYLRNRDIQTSWGDAKQGYIFQRTRDALIYLGQSKSHPKNWRPILAAVGADPINEPRLVQMGAWLECRRGLYTVAHIYESTQDHLSDRLRARDDRRDELRRHLDSLDIVAFPEVVAVKEFREGLTTFLQSYAIEGVRPNTVLASIPPPNDVEGRQRLLATEATVRAFETNLVLVKAADMALDKPQRIIDLWWRGDRNGSLMALLAYLMTLDRTWRTARLRIFRAVTDAGAEATARKHLAELLINARIDAEIHVFVARTHPHEFIPEHSGTTADIVMLGLSTVDMEQFPEYLAAMEPMLQRLPTTLLVRSNGEADLFA
ncbi:MAG: amino acid permease [Nannocystaceae bacterium]